MCPYSYLLDPLIREAIDIKLDNSVLIIDEAHNCEDVCREALSKSFELCAAQKLVEDCEIVLQQLKDDHKLRGFYCQIADLFRSISALLIRTRESFPSDAEMGSVPVHNDPRSGPAVLDLLDQCGFSPNTSVALGLAKSNLVQAHKFQNSDQVTPSTIEPVLNAASVATLESFFLVADIILLHCSDFRAVVFKERRPVIEQVEASNAGPRSRRKGSFQSRTQSDSSQPKPEESPFTVKLTLWCMNPALAFSLCSKSARSVILASGTLSPMKLMVSELGQPFPQQLEVCIFLEVFFECQIFHVLHIGRRCT
jgi:Fanconi anemia group J protein